MNNRNLKVDSHHGLLPTVEIPAGTKRPPCVDLSSAVVGVGRGNLDFVRDVFLYRLRLRDP